MQAIFCVKCFPDKPEINELKELKNIIRWRLSSDNILKYMSLLNNRIYVILNDRQLDNFYRMRQFSKYEFQQQYNFINSNKKKLPDISINLDNEIDRKIALRL